jgi:hypothetical protein
MTMRLDRTPPRSEADRAMQSALEWEAPRLPASGPSTLMRRLTGPSWTAPGKTVLVRHRAVDGDRWILSLDRHPPAGFVLEYDLGQVHLHAEPGTSRLFARGGSIFTSRVEGALADGYEHLGYIEDAPLPLLDALLSARVSRTGQLICVCGPEDPLLPHVELIGRLGFIDGYPIQPRRALDLRAGSWGAATLVRTVDVVSWRHVYAVAEGDVPNGAVSLGAVWTRGAATGLVELRVDAAGRVASDLLEPPGAPRRDPRLVVRWVGAPLAWTARRPQLWALRAAGSRAHAIATRAATRPLSVKPACLGHLRRDPGPGRVPLFSASHPAIADQFLTRSALEARDLGYTIDGILGYVGKGPADGAAEGPKGEVRWGSRFGRGRRYVEQPAPPAAGDEPSPGQTAPI